MNVISLNEINCALKNNAEDFIRSSEESYKKKLDTAVRELSMRQSRCPVLLIAGPSGSGKTTTAKRIAKALSEKGITSRAISMDDYYLSKDSPGIPYNADGSPDLESPYRLDIDLIHEHFGKIINCEEIMIPKFDFVSQSRISTTPYRRKENEIVIIEGLHALNPLISAEYKDKCTRMYISVRTRLKTEGGRLIHPSVIRLMRRLSRDVMYRGKEVTGVFDMFHSVSLGEKKYINPYKHFADIETDTFIAYEAAVYKQLLSPILKRSDLLLRYEEFADIKFAFAELLPLEQKEMIPGDSLVREFIGDSSFTY